MRSDQQELSGFEMTIGPVRDLLLASGVRRLGVFGSMARGEENATSDVDVLVTFQPESRTFDNLYAVGEALETVFRRRVDLVTEDALSPYLGPRIRAGVKYVDLGRSPRLLCPRTPSSVVDWLGV